MHQLGYKYTGPGNLYDVTFFEILSLSEGQKLLTLDADGVKSSEESYLDRFAQEKGA